MWWFVFYSYTQYTVYMRCDRHNVRFKTVVSNSKSKHTQFSTTFFAPVYFFFNSLLACSICIAAATLFDVCVCSYIYMCACMYCMLCVLCSVLTAALLTVSMSELLCMCVCGVCVYLSAAQLIVVSVVCVFFFFRHDSFSLVCARARARDCLVSAHRLQCE